MAEDTARIAAAYFDTWKAKDFATLRSLLADDMEYLGPLAHLDSADACRKTLERMADITADIVIHRTFVEGVDVLTWFDLHTTVAPPASVANWMHIEGGKIARIRALYDPRGFVSTN